MEKECAEIPNSPSRFVIPTACPTFSRASNDGESVISKRAHNSVSCSGMIRFLLGLVEGGTSLGGTVLMKRRAFLGVGA